MKTQLRFGPGSRSRKKRQQVDDNTGFFHLPTGGYDAAQQWRLRALHYIAFQVYPRAGFRLAGLAIGLLILLVPGSTQAQTGIAPLRLSWSSAETDYTTSMVWGDVDGDGDLDLAVGNHLQPSRLYRNNNGVLTTNAVWSSAETDYTTSMAWGDVDSDGDLDLAVGNGSFTYNFLSPIRLYRNDNGVLTTHAAWTSMERGYITSIAWGDVDGDGDLDLAAGNIYEPNRVYRNNNGILTANAAWSSAEARCTASVAWGDMDGDGDLDLAVGNGICGDWPSSEPNEVYRNDNGVLTASAIWSSVETDFTTSLAWGDMDGDGDLDLAAGNIGKPNRVYRNDNGVLTASAVWSSAEADNTSSVAWGDVDGDGDLDLAAGNGIFSDWFGLKPNRVYRNDNGILTAKAVWSSSETNYTTSVAWGDVDGDGDLDLAVGNGKENIGQPNLLYRNDGSVLTTNPVWSSVEADDTSSVAWGDVDGDGDLDLAIGNHFGPIRLYHNDRGVLTTSAVWSSTEMGETTSVAWGDVDGDGDLDLAVGNAEQHYRLYSNDNGVLTAGVVWSSPEVDYTTSVAWGDMDGDGDPDLAFGNTSHPNRVYRNDNGVLTSNAVWSSMEIDNTTSVAWGDVDDDGDLDLAVGNDGQPNRLYRNDNGVLTPNAVWSSLETDHTTCVAWGDMDGDGDLDLAFGNHYDPSRLYRNDNGVLTPSAVWSSAEIDNTSSVAWGDMDGDGDLDLAVGNMSYPGQTTNRLYRNDHDMLTANAVWSSAETYETTSVAWGDIDSDGDLDLAVGVAVGSDRQGVRLYGNGRNMLAFRGSAVAVSVRLPPYLAQANFYSASDVWSSPTLPITYTLFHPQNNTARYVLGYYSLDGGGHWLPAIPTADTDTTDLASASYPTSNNTNSHIYTWDVAASGMMGQSDNVVFRLVVIPSVAPRRNAIPGPFLHGSYAATTFPFRLRGTQVRVVKPENQAAPGALVYRLTEGQSSNAQFYTDHTGLAYHTDGQGYLQGRGELRKGDQLAALWPVATANLITFTRNITLYETSAKPNVETLAMQPVDKPGVQVLTVSADNKLLLFNLDVALEWDARKDAQFMEQLRFNLQRTSQLLFDWSNGQAALGQVRIFHDAKRNTSVAGFHPWADSHIRIYATNRMRPSAAEGGIISPTLEVSETVQGKLITYGPGQVHIGALWNRYGESSGALGEDWPRALAHELGHYLFFLEDDYLGFDTQGRLVTVPAEGDAAHSCPGVMNDPYRESQSEFQPEPGWIASGCRQTLAQQTTGRADWQTISHFYKNTFITPTVPFGQQNPGPSILPLTVTQLQVISPTMPTQTVAVPIFYLTKAGGGTYVPGPNAQAYLFQGDWLTDLGQPTLDQVQAWGARPHDRLCVYEAAAGYQGCVGIQPPVDQVALQQVTPWQPTIVVSPVSSRTIALQVTTALSAGQLAARLYPTDAPAPTCILLQPTEPNQYAGTFPTLAEPALDGYVHLWVQTANTPCAEPQATAGQETVTGYAIGGNPVHRRSRRTLSRGSGVHRRSRRAPAISADGQVMVFGDALDLNQEQEWFFTLQATSDAPAIPPGRTLVGQAYRLTASPNAPKLTDASISFGYLGDQVPAGEERFLHIYFWDTPSATWQPLATFVDAEYNVTSAKTQGPGLYALLASLEVPLTNVGWNNFAYPVPGTQPVAEALAAIDGAYTVVYGYQPTNATDSWLVYSPSAPDWVNDLKELAFGQGYWLYATQAITLYLQGDDSTRVTAAAGVTSTATSYGSTRVTAATGLTPPATFYGAVQTTSDFTPQVGMEVTAWIDQQVCGRSQVQKQGDALVYVIKVVAEDGSAHAGCGADGRTVSFQVNGVTMLTQGAWDNTQIWDLSLTTQLTNQAFLPLCSTNARQALHEAGNSSENHLLLPWIKQ